MRVLALDTTTRAGSAAVVDDERVLFAQRGDPLHSHAEQLPGDLIRALAMAGLAWSDVDLFAVASGPGSFTGLRIGIATVQGLAFVGRKRVVPVSALAASAYGGADGLAPGDTVGVWLDAHRREVFTALYRVRESAGFAADRLEEVEGPMVGDPATIWHRWSGLTRPVAVVGDGAVLYAGALPEGVRVIEPPLLAPIIGAIAIDRARYGGDVDPAAVQPLYVRRPDVEIARDAVLDGRRH
jgi:tRNA threonylcarbamoyladenosine biosynthesis protein TsaB